MRDVYVQFWRDYKLPWNSSEYGGVSSISVPARIIWTPDVILYNRWFLCAIKASLIHRTNANYRQWLPNTVWSRLKSPQDQPQEKISSANAEELCEHSVSLNRVNAEKCSTNCIWKGLQPVNDLQGQRRCCHFIVHIRFPISLPLYVYLCLAPFSRS